MDPYSVSKSLLQLVKLFPAIWEPENRIHYAGEHTSLRYGWIEGAVESGIRVAKEVCDCSAPAGGGSQVGDSRVR
jgi:hypothetical protein